MKNSLACPKCESRKLWRIEKVRTDDAGFRGRELPVAITTKDDKPGRFDAYVCHQCGYTEFWAHSFGDLRPDVESGIRFIDTTPQQSEYR